MDRFRKGNQFLAVDSGVPGSGERKSGEAEETCEYSGAALGAGG